MDPSSLCHTGPIPVARQYRRVPSGMLNISATRLLVKSVIVFITASPWNFPIQRLLPFLYGRALFDHFPKKCPGFNYSKIPNVTDVQTGTNAVFRRLLL
jgi:hypothetical protein